MGLSHGITKHQAIVGNNRKKTAVHITSAVGASSNKVFNGTTFTTKSDVMSARLNLGDAWTYALGIVVELLNGSTVVATKQLESVDCVANARVALPVTEANKTLDVNDSLDCRVTIPALAAAEAGAFVDVEYCEKDE